MYLDTCRNAGYKQKDRAGCLMDRSPHKDLQLGKTAQQGRQCLAASLTTQTFSAVDDERKKFSVM